MNLESNVFDKVYELPLARGYVRHWGIPEAVREILQNALDSDSPLEYTWQHGDTLTITSRNARLEPKTLLLGTTSKADRDDKIGSFGEGYKIALLVLTREGCSVKVFNNELLWQPEFRHSRVFNEEILAIKEEKYPEGRGKGLTFEVSGLSQPTIDAIVGSTLYMQESIGQVYRTSKGLILLDRPGKLYVKGLFVCDTELKFGYDIKPEFLKLERDRQTVNSFDLEYLTKEMWFETGEHDKIAELLEAETPDLKYASWGTPEVVKEACYRRFQEKYPGKIAAKNQEELEALIKEGLTETVVIGGTYGAVVRSSTPYTSSARPVQQTPYQIMEQWFREHRGNMRREAIVSFEELLAKSQNWRPL